MNTAAVLSQWGSPPDAHVPLMPRNLVRESSIDVMAMLEIK